VRSRIAALLTPLALVAAACSSASSASPKAAPSAPPSAQPSTAASATPGAQVDLEIYAAASLKKVLAEAKTAYEAATPGVTLTISTDASSALAAKIEQGAPADVFLSADTKNPQALVDEGLANAPP
jgi:molybdate transport system substrate-binding protein